MIKQQIVPPDQLDSVRAVGFEITEAFASFDQIIDIFDAGRTWDPRRRSSRHQ